jgi:PIN domain nuclease of toxin-antitoxin system
LLDDPANEPIFSAVSLWEIAIKRGLGRDDFQVDARMLGRVLLDNDYACCAVDDRRHHSTDGRPDRG